MPQYQDDEELTLNYLEAANDRNVDGMVFANRKNSRMYRDALRKLEGNYAKSKRKIADNERDRCRDMVYRTYGVGSRESSTSSS